MKYKNHIKTNQSVILMFDDHEPMVVPRENGEYEQLAKLIAHGKYNDIPKVASRILRLKEGSGDAFDIVDGKVVIDGESLPESLSMRILEFVDQNLPVQTFLNFWGNLRQNPSESSREDLFNFLEKNHVPLTEDGSFVCYKKVGRDYWDCHTGKTHQYKPGSVVKMPREKVDSNRNNTCSSGLHVAGWGYLGSFPHGSIVVEAKVNPKNVCAVPKDYNFTKIRVCELEIIRDCPKFMGEDVQLYDEDKAVGYVEDEDEFDEDYHCDEYDEEEEDYDYDNEEDDEYVEDEDEDEDEEVDIETIVIRRIPSFLRFFVPSADGRARITLPALEKIGIESGQTIYASVASKRSRSITLSVDEPMGVLYKKDLVVGTSSVRLPASAFRAAQIHLDDGYDEYKLTCSKGNIIVRGA